MKKQTGRPTVMTEAAVQKLEQALRDGFSVEMACHVSGIGRSTYYDHVKSDPVFSHKMELAQDWPTQRAKQVVIQEINKGNLKAAQWWLEKRNRDEFGVNPPPPKEVWGAERLFGTAGSEKAIDFMSRTLVALDIPPPASM